MVVLSAALMPIASACGGGGGSCAKVAPCGGDVTGNWTISGACFNAAALNMNIGMSCPGAAVNIRVFSVTGSASFNADLTYTTAANGDDLASRDDSGIVPDRGRGRAHLRRAGPAAASRYRRESLEHADRALRGQQRLHLHRHERPANDKHNRDLHHVGDDHHHHRKRRLDLQQRLLRPGERAPHRAARHDDADGHDPGGYGPDQVARRRRPRASRLRRARSDPRSDGAPPPGRIRPGTPNSS